MVTEHALQCQQLSKLFFSLSDSFCTLNTNYRRVGDDQRGVINCLTSLILYFSRCTESCTDFYSPSLCKDSSYPSPRSHWSLSSILSYDWPVISASPRSCFLISNLDCSERAAVLHTAADMRVSISENIIYGDQNILLLRSCRGKLLPSSAIAAGSRAYKWKRWKIKFSGFVRVAPGSG